MLTFGSCKITITPLGEGQFRASRVFRGERADAPDDPVEIEFATTITESQIVWWLTTSFALFSTLMDLCEEVETVHWASPDEGSGEED